jgi:hypothetical protein
MSLLEKVIAPLEAKMRSDLDKMPEGRNKEAMRKVVDEYKPTFEQALKSGNPTHIMRLFEQGKRINQRARREDAHGHV